MLWSGATSATSDVCATDQKHKIIDNCLLNSKLTTYDSKFGSLLCDWNDGLSSTYGDNFDLQRFNIR